jgi:DNA-binding transcriptional regulator YiaG
MLRLAELKSVTRVQRRTRREWNVAPPTRKSIYEWEKTLRDTGSLISHAGKHPKQHVTEETVDRVRESFSRSPRKSSRELGVPRSTVHNIVNKRLRLHAYKLKLLHHIKPDDHRKGTGFAVEMLSRIEENYLDLVLFSDESTFHMCWKVNWHNCRIWFSENPHQVIEYERDTPKLNVWL